MSKMQHSLSDESTRAATVLASWCNMSGLIPLKELEATFNEKSKRPKGNNNAGTADQTEEDEIEIVE